MLSLKVYRLKVLRKGESKIEELNRIDLHFVVMIVAKEMND